MFKVDQQGINIYIYIYIYKGMHEFEFLSYYNQQLQNMFMGLSIHQRLKCYNFAMICV